ncbi:MAG: acyl-CoA synthetase [Solirubrobacteraceae bacterium]
MHPGAHPADHTAIVMADSGETVTYGELDASANRISRVMRSLGLGVGDHMALCIENRREIFDVLWGAHDAGLLYTALSTRLGADEMAYIVQDCGARVFVLSARYADLADEVRAATPGVEHHLSLGGEIPGWTALEDLMAEQSDQPLDEQRIGGKDMLYSSGTTGRPKGIRPKELEAPLDASPIIVTPILGGKLGVGPGSVYLTPAPMYHAAPLRFSMAIHQLGGTVVLMERFTPERALELIAGHGVTHTQMVPTMFVRMLRLPASARDAADVSSLKVVIHAGAPCPREVKQQMIDWWGPIIHEYYASTEGAGLTWVTSEEWVSHPGTVGRAAIGTPRILAEEEDVELPVGQTGRVFFSDGPQFEYHNDPDKTRGAHSSQGWSTAGDIGHLDEEGFLYLTDRASFMIISGGVNIYPQESENVLASHPKVMDAAVFGIPDEDFGESVKAVIQPMEMPADDAAAAALEAELIAHCRAQLADLKCPRSIDFRAELPRHETGKLYKRLLRDEYRERAAAGA